MSGQEDMVIAIDINVGGSTLIRLNILHDSVALECMNEPSEDADGKSMLTMLAKIIHTRLMDFVEGYEDATVVVCADADYHTVQ